MLELFKMAIESPLKAIVATLCAVVLFLQLTVASIQVAIAGIESEQKFHTQSALSVIEQGKEVSGLHAKIDMMQKAHTVWREGTLAHRKEVHDLLNKLQEKHNHEN